MKIIGHRGAMGYEPENTLRSLDRAIRDGVDAVEFDVHCLTDGEIVLIHDPTLERTTNGTGFVSEKTYDQIKKLNAGKGEHVPTLREALTLIDRRVPVIIELCGFKSSSQNVAQIIHEYVEKKNWKYTDFSISSFIQKELALAKKYLPEVTMGANISAIPLTHAKFTQDLLLHFVASEDLYLRDREFVDDAHARGLAFYVYSIDTHWYLERFEKLGIDGFYTNFPNRFKKR